MKNTTRVEYQAAPIAECEGIPVFLRFSNIDAELSRFPNETKAIALARKADWKTALEAVYDPDMVAYSADPVRTNFLDLLPLSKNTIALEIGVGFGQHTVEIASRVKRLDTFEVRLVNSLFTRIRCEQSGAANVTFTCGGDDCRLPFVDSSYDVVILNLVLEWCGSGNPEEPQLNSQRRLLSEIQRVLKPGGLLQISTKNRFAYRLLIGGRDEHAYAMRFGSSLPRWLFRLILRLRQLSPTPGYLHSYGGLKKLIASAGLSVVASYWTAPEMRCPEQYISMEARTIRTARRKLARQGNTRLTNLLMRATPSFLVRYFTPGLFFIAQKQ